TSPTARHAAPARSAPAGRARPGATSRANSTRPGRTRQAREGMAIRPARRATRRSRPPRGARTKRGAPAATPTAAARPAAARSAAAPRARPAPGAPGAAASPASTPASSPERGGEPLGRGVAQVAQAHPCRAAYPPRWTSVMDLHAPGALPPGATFGGRYRVARCVSAGGMGAIYEVVHLDTRRRRALKVMLPGLADDPDVRARFEREATIASAVRSEHVVDVMDAGVDGDTGMPF